MNLRFFALYIILSIFLFSSLMAQTEDGPILDDKKSPELPSYKVFKHKHKIVKVRPRFLPQRALRSRTKSIAKVSDIPPAEREILIALYNATNGSDWDNNDNWLGASGTEGTWYGIELSESGDHVIGIDLSENNLTGSLPSQLGNLPELRYLVIWDNRVGGNIPPQLGNLSNLDNLNLNQNQFEGDIPTELGNLTLLNWLSLSGNNFTPGPIPAWIQDLINLVGLDMWNTNLIGEIPVWLNSLTNLGHLNFDDNNLTGSIPFLGSLTNLWWLGLGGNDFAPGPIPAWIQGLSNLEGLNLWDTNLTGNIPAWIGSLTALTGLSLDSNQLTGSIPNLGSLINLRWLNLGGNNFTPGPVPPWLQGMTRLEGLHMWDAKLTGTIPTWIGSLTDLNNLNLGENQLGGNIPPQITNLHNLERLELSSNQLTGNIPDLGGLTSLRSLSLGANEFNPGPIPEWIQGLTDLEDLNMWDMNLTGTIPAWIGDLSRLRGLGLNNNQFTGSLPDLGSLTNLNWLNLGGNDFTPGPMPTWIQNLTNLEWLGFWDMNFTGAIPAWLGSMTILRSLNLGWNEFSPGPLPEWLQNMLSLEEIWLNGVNLTGEIPTWIGNLLNLIRLNLAVNGLTGSMPAELQSLTNLQDLNLRRNDFAAGPIPSWIQNLTRLENLNLSRTNRTGDIPSEMGNLTSLRNLDLGGNEFTPGPLPSWVQGLLSLEYLGLYNANLTGEIPDWIGNLANLTNLNLWGNQLTGTPPPELGNLHNLTSLYLGDNDFAPGPIPAWLQNLQKLEWLGLWSMNFTGVIPAWIGSLSNLMELDLDSNDLTGSIPDLSSLTNLISLWLGNNDFIPGPIPAWLQSLHNLEWLGFYAMNLTGDIPAWIGGFPNLRHINMRDNQLTGVIPAELGDLPNLEVLYLRNNDFAPGPIPTWIQNPPNLRNLDLGNTNRTGEIPTWIGNLSNLYYLILGENQLTGEMPAELGDIESLGYLGLYYNDFTPGPIPEWLLNPPNLIYASLGATNRTGAIPQWIENFSSNFVYFYFYENQLTGSIPPELGSLTDMMYIRLDGNQLSGNIPPELGNLENLEWLFLRSNQLEGSIPPEIENLTNLDDFDPNVEFNNSLDWNALYLANGSAGLKQGNPLKTLALSDFLAQKFGNWAATQTVPPTDVSATPVSSDTIEVSWTPIAYTADPGGYRVFYSQTSGGPYTEAGITPDKSATSFEVTQLNPNTPYFLVVQTQTNPHENNQNTLLSEYSEEVSATTTTECTPPDITTQPQSQTIDHNTSATLTVEASGTTPYEYQWYQGQTGDTSTPVETNSNEYTTPNLTSTTSYWVRVTNSCGEADSQTATITVIGPAENIVAVGGNCQSGTVNQALANAFVVEVTDGSGQPVSGVEVEWSIVGTPIGAAGQDLSVATTFTNLDGRAESLLTLGNRAGTYTVRAAFNGTSVVFTATTGQTYFLKGGVFHKFSVPFVLANGNAEVVLDELGPYSPSSWRLFRYGNGTYQEYPLTPDFALGLGFWLICAQDTVISTAGTVPGGDVTVTLQPGWTQIGCPYDCSVSWARIKQANPAVFTAGIGDVFVTALADVLWGYDSVMGEYVMSTHMEPWKAYWVYNHNSTPITDFVIPNPKND